MLSKKKILHFHPNGNFAQHFVRPLIDAEIAAGHNSAIVTSVNSDALGAIEIPYDLSLKNLFLLPFVFFRFIGFYVKNPPMSL